jgi:hypothetical protein
MIQMQVARMKFLTLTLAAVTGLPAGLLANGIQPEPVKYYLDSQASAGGGNGTKEHPWPVLKFLDQVIFQPGDLVLFKRGSSFEGGFEVNQSGTSNAPIVFRPYGEGAALPRFTNPQSAVLSGNAIRLNASYLIVDGLFFEQCPANPCTNDIRTLGAIFLTTNANHNIIRHCEMTQTPVGITVYGQHNLITRNNIHDDNEPVKPHWGPMAVVVCSSHNEIAYNRFVNYCAPSEEYGHDGGAIEINDRSLPKEDILIHHNLSLRNQGFIEWVGQVAKNDPRNLATGAQQAAMQGGFGPVIQDHFWIHHNVCEDYQSFLGFTGPCSNMRVENNTVVRTLAHDQPDSEDVIFWSYRENTNISFVNNIFAWNGTRVEPVFARGQPYHAHNLFYRTDETNLPAGPSVAAYQRRYLGGGAELNTGDRINNPRFRDPDHDDFRLSSNSPAIGLGANLHYPFDFDNHLIPTNHPAIGAYEFDPKPN